MQRKNCSHCWVKGIIALLGNGKLLYCWEKGILALLGNGYSCSENGILALLGKGKSCTAGKGNYCIAGKGNYCIAGKGNYCIAGKGNYCTAGKGNYCIAGKREILHCWKRELLHCWKRELLHCWKRELLHCWKKGFIPMVEKGNYSNAGKRELLQSEVQLALLHSFTAISTCMLGAGRHPQGRRGQAEHWDCCCPLVVAAGSASGWAVLSPPGETCRLWPGTWWILFFEFLLMKKGKKNKVKLLFFQPCWETVDFIY